MLTTLSLKKPGSGQEYGRGRDAQDVTMTGVDNCCFLAEQKRGDLVVQDHPCLPDHGLENGCRNFHIVFAFESAELLW